MAVLVTRPDQQGKALCEMLNKEGIAAWHLPLFSIEAGRELNQLPNKMSQLKAGDYVLAVSKNAVSYASESLYNAGFHWREDLHYFAVGQRSAEFFSSHSEQNVHFPFAQENSEGLLNLPFMQDLTDKQILILRGNGGRELFPQQAQQRGASLDIVECYQRIPIQYDRQQQSDMLKRAGINTIFITSSEILHLLVEFVPEEEHSWLKSCNLIVVSQRIAQVAQQLGWQQITIAPRADNQSLLDAVLTLNDLTK